MGYYIRPRPESSLIVSTVTQPAPAYYSQYISMVDPSESICMLEYLLSSPLDTPFRESPSS